MRGAARSGARDPSGGLGLRQAARTRGRNTWSTVSAGTLSDAGHAVERVLGAEQVGRDAGHPRHQRGGPDLAAGDGTCQNGQPGPLQGGTAPTGRLGRVPPGHVLAAVLGGSGRSGSLTPDGTERTGLSGPTARRAS